MRALSGAFLVVLIVLVGSACGTGGPAKGGSASQGKKLFTDPKTGRCATCHTLSDAPGAKGTIGPNLDHAFMRSREEGFRESTIRNIVLDQIRFPTSGSGMPANLVEGQDAEDVAAYVASVAGKATAAGTTTTGGGTGKELFVSLGCQSCHTLDGTKATGPTFKGLFGKNEKLAGGQTVMVDEAYLLAAILDPDKQIVQGYQPGVMTAVIQKNQVSQADAKKLVAFIRR